MYLLEVMPPKTKQKQSQKQEQNVKIVINQNDNKKGKKTKKKQTTKRTQKSSQKSNQPPAYGYTPEQSMRAYQTYTPQISNNSVPDFNNVINALRSSILGRQEIAIKNENKTPTTNQWEQEMMPSSIQKPANTSRKLPRQSVMFSSPRTVFGTEYEPQSRYVNNAQQTQSDEYVDLTNPVIYNKAYTERTPVRFNQPNERDIMPTFDIRNSDSDSLLGDTIPITMPNEVKDINTYDLPQILKTPDKAQGGYVFQDLASGRGYSSQLSPAKERTPDFFPEIDSDMVEYSGFPVSNVEYRYPNGQAR